MHNGPTNRVDPTGLWDTGLFWDNVDKLDPAARKWFQGDFQGRTIRRNASWYKLATPKSIGGYEKFRDPNDLNKYNEHPVIFLHEGYNEIEAAYQFIHEIREGFWAAEWKAKDIDNPLEPWKAAAAAQEFKEWYIKQAAKTVLQGTQVIGAFYSIQMKGVDWIVTINDIADGEVDVNTLVSLARVVPLTKAGKFKLKDRAGNIVGEVAQASYRMGIKAGASHFPNGAMDDFVRFSRRIPNEEGFFDLYIHSMGKGTTLAQLGTDKAREAAHMLQIERTLVEAGWKPGQSIRLISCRAGDPALGKQAAAQKLAEHFSVKVKAPTEDIILFESGAYVISNKEKVVETTKSTGTWRVFGD